jgi:colicin import membrane protein
MRGAASAGRGPATKGASEAFRAKGYRQDVRIAENAVRGDRVRAMAGARKLKTYQTSIGFFDLVVAAPSMKAAMIAGGSNTNLFHQGFAKETTDPAIVKAIMDKPGVVLRRPVGANGAFIEHAELPSNLATGTTEKAPSKPEPKTRETPRAKIDNKAERKAAHTVEREQNWVETKRREAEAARESEARRRERAS